MAGRVPLPYPVHLPCTSHIPAAHLPRPWPPEVAGRRADEPARRLESQAGHGGAPLPRVLPARLAGARRAGAGTGVTDVPGSWPALSGAPGPGHPPGARRCMRSAPQVYGRCIRAAGRKRAGAAPRRVHGKCIAGASQEHRRCMAAGSMGGRTIRHHEELTVHHCENDPYLPEDGDDGLCRLRPSRRPPASTSPGRWRRSPRRSAC